jgi:HEAT repeat protein
MKQKLKSTMSSLKKRGFVGEPDNQKILSLSRVELITMLEDSDPCIRTSSARALISYRDDKTISILCSALKNESGLYTKIAICNTLQRMGSTAADQLVKLLGMIGSNQHTEPSAKIFRKKSYPLPRDIAARTLAHMGHDAIPSLLRILETGTTTAIREAIDAIGFICFYDPYESAFGTLYACLSRYQDDPVIRWKIAIALRSFTSKQSIELLDMMRNNDPIPIVRKEAAESKKIILSLI